VLLRPYVKLVGIVLEEPQHVHFAPRESTVMCLDLIHLFSVRNAMQVLIVFTVTKFNVPSVISAQGWKMKSAQRVRTERQLCLPDFRLAFLVLQDITAKMGLTPNVPLENGRWLVLTVLQTARLVPTESLL